MASLFSKLFKIRKKKQQKVGGFFFFSSLLALLIVAIIHALAILFFIPQIQIWRLLIFLPGIVLGAAIALFLPKRWSVFLHELKHSFPSHLVGNRDKGISVEDDGGEFRYAYSEQSAKYNALISLAPYFLPLTSIAFLPIVFFLLNPHGLAACFVVGTAFGFDLVCNFLDLGPHQSDLTGIRGGPRIANCYVVLSNIAWSSIVLIWVLGDVSGLMFLVNTWWQMCLYIAGAHSGKVSTTV